MRRIVDSAAREIDRAIKLNLALGLAKASPRSRRFIDEQCWLIGSMSGLAYADNSAALHRYVTENYPNLRVYWVMNRDSPDVERVRRIGPVLYREELATYVYGLQAQVHVISHGLADVPSCGSPLSDRALKVRLGHGLTALKKTKGSPWRSVEAKNRGFDLVPVASEFEKRNKMEWGIDPAAFVVTGLPRFDDLVRRAAHHESRPGAGASSARILYMPTWRDWLPRSEKAFRETQFYQDVVAFLFHPDLGPLLERHNAVIDVYVHVIMRKHAPTLVRDVARLSQVRVLPPETDLQDALARSRLLITDYSSVAWDFLYVDRPVLFYQFDVEEFSRHRGSHIDLRNLFGPIAHDADIAVEIVQDFLDSGFDAGPYRASMGKWQERAFCYRDTNNCERVVQAILERLESL